MSRSYFHTKEEGEKTEAFLKPILETLLDDVLEAQESTARLDFKGQKTGFHEIKSRDPYFRSDDQYAEKGWFIGMPKICAALVTEQPVSFWYFFHSDKTLWKIQFDTELFASFRPFRNRQGQETIAIPKRFWTKVEYL